MKQKKIEAVYETGKLLYKFAKEIEDAAKQINQNNINFNIFTEKHQILSPHLSSIGDLGAAYFTEISDAIRFRDFGYVSVLLLKAAEQINSDCEVLNFNTLNLASMMNKLGYAIDEICGFSGLGSFHVEQASVLIRNLDFANAGQALKHAATEINNDWMTKNINIYYYINWIDQLGLGSINIEIVKSLGENYLIKASEALMQCEAHDDEM